MLAAGEKAPDFKLQDLYGPRRTLSGVADGRPVLLAFFKVACPTCQYTLPYLERMFRNKTNRDIGMYAISQDDAESTREFHREFGVTMPTLLDREEEGYPASNEYGLAHVPSLFLIEADGKISASLHGFDKSGLMMLGERLGAEPFQPGEQVPDWRPG
jgi:peroxiredoxin